MAPDRGVLGSAGAFGRGCVKTRSGMVDPETTFFQRNLRQYFVLSRVAARGPLRKVFPPDYRNWSFHTASAQTGRSAHVSATVAPDPQSRPSRHAQRLTGLGPHRTFEPSAANGTKEPRVTGIMPRLRCWCIRPLPALLKHSCKTQHDAKRLHDGPSSVTGVDDLAAFCGQDRPDDPGHMAYARVIATPVVPREMKWEAIDFERRGNTDEVAPVVRLE